MALQWNGLPGPQLYHERQEGYRRYSALHALNNLAQQKLYTSSQLHSIAADVDPYSSATTCWPCLSTRFSRLICSYLKGDHGFVCVRTALSEKGNDVYKQNEPRLTDDSRIMGILVYDMHKAFFFCGRKRWIALRKVGNFWYNFDCRLPAPKPFTDQDEVKTFLDNSRIHRHASIYVVMKERYP